MEYIAVEALWRRDGTIIPSAVNKDGRGHKVQVRRITAMEKTKKGGSEYRYEVTVYGKPDVLYFERGESYTELQRWRRSCE